MAENDSVLLYSPLKAITGSSFAARLAGLSPKKIPTKTENTKVTTQACVLIINALVKGIYRADNTDGRR